jgi:hypothetical protein
LSITCKTDRHEIFQSKTWIFAETGKDQQICGARKEKSFFFLLGGQRGQKQPKQDEEMECAQIKQFLNETSKQNLHAGQDRKGQMVLGSNKPSSRLD